MLIIYGMGEGVSVVRRLKVLQLSFSGVLITSAPNNPQWPQLLGSDGDFIVTPAQWHSTQDSPCFLFGNSSNYAREYAARFGSLPSYFSAGLTAAGLILQLAMQVRHLLPCSAGPKPQLDATSRLAVNYLHVVLMESCRRHTAHCQQTSC